MTPAQSTVSKNRTLIGFVIATLLTLGLAVLAIANAQDTETAAPAATDTVTQVMLANSPEYGDYLTDANGRAMYIFLNDTSGVSNCMGDCIANWPPVLVTADTDLTTLSPELDAALLTTLEREDGTMQLVYNGWPLYYYIGDTAAGDVTGHDLNDVWYLVTPMGTGAGIEAGQPGGDAAPQ